MILTEIHNISINHKDWKQIDSLCFFSKNLYNACLYKIKQTKMNTGKFLRYQDLEKLMRIENNPDYFSIPTASSQQILRLVDRNLKSFFALLKKYKKDKKSLIAPPQFPWYKHKTKGRNVMIIRGDTIRLKDGYIHFPKRFNLSPVKTLLTSDTKINEVRLVPQSGCYKIEIVYERQEKEPIVNDKILSIDLGLNNLFSCVTNFNQKPLIINGRPLKSINQYYNKKKGEIQSQLEKNHKRKTSKRLQRLTMKRNNKIKDYLHKSTRIIVDYCIENRVSKVIIGYNKGWKQNINLGSVNNQNFVSVPFLTAINQLKYKLKLEGIECITREESYTSKCSALDLESIEKHDQYLGQRSTRGIFKSMTGTLINADINGALNIMRKEIQNDSFMNLLDRGSVLDPIKIYSL